MLLLHGPLLCALSLGSALPTQDEPDRTGFEALASDPFAAGLFEEVAVTPGPPARVVTRDVSGTRGEIPFVNVLRIADARRFRSKLISIRLPVRLDAATVDTSARLWVRVLRSDGTVAFDDTGLDRATSSSEWTTLSSTGAVADDATDLWFGLIVEGTTLVHMQDFGIEVGEKVSPLDVRHAVPQRWASDPDVRSAHVIDADLGLDLRVTSFVPPGHSARDLPHLWLVRDDVDLRRSYVVGRAFLEAMRLGQDPPAIVSLVQPTEGVLPALAATTSGVEAVQVHLGRIDSGLASRTAHAISGPSGLVVPTALADALPVLSNGEGATSEGSALHAERVLLRWVRARQDAGDDAELASMLFDASIVALEPWDSRAVVRQLSHSLAGHDCGHDHSHDHTHHH